MNIYSKIIVFVMSYAIKSVALYFIFDKANVKSYHALIPVVRYHTLFKTVWHSAYFYPYIVLNVILTILNYFIDILLSYNEASFALILFSIVYLAVGIVTLMLFVKLQIRTAKAFSRSKGCCRTYPAEYYLPIYSRLFKKVNLYRSAGRRKVITRADPA